MKFPIFGASNDDMGTADIYAYLGNTHSIDWNATENRRQIPLTEDVTITDLKVMIDTAPGAGRTRTFTVRKNGVDTGVTVTISDTATSATFSGSVAFAAGDLVTLKASSTGAAPAAPGNTYWHLFMNTVGMKALLMGGCQNAASNVNTNYQNIFGANVQSTVSGDQDVPVAAAGTITKLSITSNTVPGVGKSYAFSVRINNATDALTATLSGTGTTTASATGSQALAAGDTIQMKSVPTGTPNTVATGWCVTFEPTNIGETICGYGGVGALSTTATNYEQPFGTGGGGYGTEANRLLKLPACTIKNLYVRISAAPGAAATRTFTLRDNNASSSLVVTIANPNTTGNDTAHTVTHTADQPIALQASLTGVPAAANGHFGFVIVTAQPAQTVAPAGVASSVAFGTISDVERNVTPAAVGSSVAYGTAVVANAAGAQTVNLAATSGYATRITALAPAGYWRLNDLTDSSGNAKTLSNAGSGTPTTGVAAARLIDNSTDGGGYLSDSGNTWWNTAMSIPTNGAAWSLCGWVQVPNLDGLANAFGRRRVLSLQPGNNNFGPGLELFGTENLIGDGSTLFAQIPGRSQSGAAARFFWALTYDGTTRRMYVNGVEVASKTGATSDVTGGAATFTHAVIGKAFLGAAGNIPTVESYVDEVAVFTSALTAANVAALYNEGRRGFGAGPVVSAALRGADSGRLDDGPIVIRNLFMSGAGAIASTAAAGSHTVTNGAQTVAPAGVSRTPALGTATVAAVAYVTPAGVASSVAYGTAIVARGAVTILPAGVSRTPAFGSPTASSVAYVTPAGVASSVAYGTAIVARGAVTILPAGVNRTVAYGTAIVARGAVTILPAGVASTSALGSPTASSVAYVTPAGVASSFATGAPVIAAAGAIVPTGIASTYAGGSATVLPGAATILPAGAASSAAVGAAAVTTVAYVTPAGVASSAAVGEPAFDVAGVIAPPGINRTVAYGTAIVARGAVTIAPPGINRTVTHGTATVTTVAYITPAGVAPTSAFGTLLIVSGPDLDIDEPTAAAIVVDAHRRGVVLADAGRRDSIVVDDGRRLATVIN